MIYDVVNYGAVGDGMTNNTEVFNDLAKKIGEQGGGIMYIPAGRYVTGTIFIQSNTTVYLESGAVIAGSDNFEEYPLIIEAEVPGYTRKGRWGILASCRAENISVQGKGVIEGNGQNWWEKVKSDLVRPRTITFIQCKNVSVKDITIQNSPAWTIHPVCCENITIDAVSIMNPYHAPNTDGINPESCKNVRISNCYVDVGDDCITIKSGTEDDTLQKGMPCENVVITNCTLAHGHGGVVFGSEMSGGISNITVNNCVFQNTDRGIRIKTRRKRGGFITGLMISNIIMDNVLAGITINEFYRCGEYQFSAEELFSEGTQPVDETTPSIENVNISNIIAKNVKGSGIYLYGLPEMPIRNLALSNISIHMKETEEEIEPIMTYRRIRSKGEGVYLKNVKDISLVNVCITDSKDELIVQNCEGVIYNGRKI